MPSLRAALAGVLVFPVVVASAALTAPFALLVGACCTVLFWALLFGWLQFAPPERVAPGFGLSVVLLAVFGLLVGVESVVLGALVGFVRR